jgi:putative endonuclease
VRTQAQQWGDAAESLVADRLSAAGWHVLARQLHVGRAEIDILAIDPGPPRNLVAVEVRWRTRRDFGLVEETVDWRKVQRLRRAAWALRERATLADGTGVPRLPARIDLIAVEPGAADGPVRVRHHRAVG